MSSPAEAAKAIERQVGLPSIHGHGLDPYDFKESSSSALPPSRSTTMRVSSSVPAETRASGVASMRLTKPFAVGLTPKDGNQCRGIDDHAGTPFLS